MDSNALSSNQIISQPAIVRPSANTEGVLKSFINLRINRKTFLIGIILYQVIYYFGLDFFISWEDPMVDRIYFPLFYAVSHIILMLFYVWRLHDINRSGFWIIPILILRIMAFSPYLYFQLSFPRMILNLAFIAFLLYKKGSEGVNDYSEKPKIFSSLF